MKTVAAHSPRQFPLRGICMTAAALLFALSAYELIFAPGSHVATWRGLALSSLYLVMCLTQRRLFSSHRTAKHRLTSQ